MGKNIFYFIIAIAILLIVGGVILYFTQQEQEEVQRSPAPVPQREGGLGSELYQNPGSKVPETNPFQQAKTNPFESYKNPFD